MRKRYTDEDVARLVTEADSVVYTIEQDMRIYKGSARHEFLVEALAPFRPDPEEELIEAMAKEFDEAIQTNGHYNYPTEVGMRAALAVVKEKGYFNDKR